MGDVKRISTEAGMIPEDWDTCILGDAFTRIEAGVSVNSDERIASEYFVLKTSAVRNGIVDVREAKPVIATDYHRLKCPLQKGSIVISRMNTPELVGAIGYNSDDHEDVFLPDRLWQITEGNESNFDFRWLSYLLNLPRFRDAVRSTATGTSNSMKNISKDRLKEISIPKPSLREQVAIGTAIESVDELIASIDCLITKKQAIRTGVIENLITGKERLTGFSSNWISINMSKKSKLKARIGWQGLTTGEYLDSGYAYLVTGTDFSDGYINWSSCHYVTENRYVQDPNIQIKNGDVLLTKDGTIGKVALVDGLTKPATLNSGVFVIRPIDCAYSAHFLYYVLSSSVFRDFLEKLSAGSTIVHLYQKDLVKFDFSAPPTIEEQEAIASMIYDMELEIIHLKKKREKYQNLKDGMMNELLTGKVRLV